MKRCNAVRSLQLVAISFLLMAVPTADAQLTIFLPENSNYRHVNATGSAISVAADWYTIGFDDSSWSLGPGPFGNGFGANLSNAAGPNTPNDPGYPQGTPWSEHADPYLRTTFSLPAPMDLTLWLAVDNGVNSLYLNGVLATAGINAEGAAFRWEHVFDVPASYTYAGLNTLALQLEDHGQLTGYALVITSNDPADNPVLSTNPPPPPRVPEPAACQLMSAALAIAAVYRRKASRSRPA